MGVSGDTMDIAELAAYLHRDAREVGKLVSRGHVPGRKVRGEWRFALPEINQWLETQLPEYTDEQLAHLDAAARTPEHGESLISELLSQASIALPLPATTRTSVLIELVQLAEQTWMVYDPDAILAAVRQREETLSTALPSGVALPHPHRPLPDALGESLIALGRTSTGIPFGGPRGGLTDIFFLVCCRDDRTHLRVLARLTRLFLREEFLEALRLVETPAEAWDLIATTERGAYGTSS